MKMGHIRRILFDPRKAASEGLFEPKTLYGWLVLTCVLLYAPRILRSFQSWEYGIWAWLTILFQELFLLGVAFAFFAAILPAKLEIFISRFRKTESRETLEFMNTTLFALLIYLSIAFPLNIVVLFVDWSKIVCAISLFWHGVVASVFTAVWFYKALIPKYIERNTKEVRIIMCYFFLTILVTLIIVLNFDFIWLMIISPKGGIR